MASKDRYGRIKKKIEKLRHNSLAVASKANQIIADGVQRIADRELHSLNEAYQGALTALKRSSDKRDDLVSRAHQQLDVMQRAADQLIASARHALEVASKARADLTGLVGQALQGKKVSRRDIERAVKPARDLLSPRRKAPAKKKTAAAGGGKRAATRSKPRAAASGKPRQARKPAARPSPNSRAGRATSTAKQEAGSTPAPAVMEPSSPAPASNITPPIE